MEGSVVPGIDLESKAITFEIDHDRVDGIILVDHHGVNRSTIIKDPENQAAGADLHGPLQGRGQSTTL